MEITTKNLKVTNLQVFFDNGGGITVQCDGYTYRHDDPKVAAKEVFEFFNGGDLSDPHDKNIDHLEDDESLLCIDSAQIIEIINNAEYIFWKQSQSDEEIFFDTLISSFEKKSSGKEAYIGLKGKINILNADKIIKIINSKEDDKAKEGA